MCGVGKDVEVRSLLDMLRTDSVCFVVLLIEPGSL